MPDVINVYAEALVALANANECGLGADAEAYVRNALERSLGDRVIHLSVIQAVHDMLWTSGEAGWGEEHQTASLMGHLTSSLGWYSLAALVSAADLENASALVPDIRWANQEKTEEPGTGVDFGIARLIRDPDAGPLARVALFQAKLAKKHGADWTADTAFISGRNSREAQAVLQSGPTHHDAVYAHSELPFLMRALVGGDVAASLEFRDRRKEDAILARMSQYPMTRPRFQVEALLRTSLRGKIMARARRPWCFYSVWFGKDGATVPEPRAFSVDRVVERFWTNPTTKVPSKCAVDMGNDDTLIAVLANVLAGDVPAFGIDIRLDDLQSLVGTLAPMNPRLQFLLAGGSGAGGAKFLAAFQQHFDVSAPMTEAARTAQSALQQARAAEQTQSYDQRTP